MKKAVFVDGASLSHMRRPLGIRNFNYKELYTVFTQIGSSIDLYSAPLYVTRGSQEDHRKLWAKSLRTAGFNVQMVESIENGEDDAVIIEAIERLDPRVVSEIVIVSADQDYATALRDKAKEGVIVFWVATMNVSPDGKNMLGSVLQDLFDEKVFTFVDLNNFADQITRTVHPVKHDPVSETLDEQLLRVTFETIMEPSLTQQLVRELLEVLGKYEVRKFTIQSE